VKIAVNLARLIGFAALLNLSAGIASGTPAAKSGSVGSAPESRPPKCAHVAATLRERLESIVEASIDGRPARAAPAARRVHAYWDRHRQALGAPAEAESLMHTVDAAVTSGKPREAARSAVLLSEASLAWCDASLGIKDHLSCLDLVGQAAWLRAKGLDTPWPNEADKSASAVTVALRARARGGLADSLQASIAAAMKIPVAAGANAGDRITAIELLDLVDVMEKALR